ncbi:hypothetical protein H2203_000488 [Taxawa tesnikishii (nom. ined.)]|nr:hypothetical protein H2203_000488 [Dothideales sp. JES 119]
MNVPIDSESLSLPILASSSTSSERRNARFEDEVRATVSRRRIPRVEKDVDDPTSPVKARGSLDRQESTTLTMLSRLFAVQASTSPTNSRHPSFNNQTGIEIPRRVYSSDIASLPDHLYTRGLLGGRHSDITVHAFGYPYKLHRLILDRAGFFASALSGPWLESEAKDITLHPEDIDSNITHVAFELALKRLYGTSIAEEEDEEAVGLFATGCWLEMPDLIDSSIEAMLRQMHPKTYPH